MFEYLSQFEPVLLVLLGWSMGLLSPPLVDRIRRHYRQRDLMRAVLDELRGLQYTMVMVAWNHRMHNAEVTDEFLDSALPVVESYAGPDRDQATIERLRNSRARPEDQRRALHQAMGGRNKALALKVYDLPLFLTQLGQLAICPLDFQRAVLNVRYHLDLFNQSVPPLQSLFEKTFTDISSGNRTIINENLENGYHSLRERAEIIVSAITRLQQCYTTKAESQEGLTDTVMQLSASSASSGPVWRASRCKIAQGRFNMKEIFSAFGSEVFRPLVTLVLPGAVATSTGWIAALWAHAGFRTFADRNHAEVIGAGFVIAIIVGLICEDVGARIEDYCDKRAMRTTEPHLRAEWYTYLRQAFRIEPVGHRYLRTLVLRLKFELGMAVGSLLATAGLWWLPTTFTMRAILTLAALLVSAYFLWEARSSHETLYRLRQELLKGVTVVPAEGGRASGAQ